MTEPATRPIYVLLHHPLRVARVWRGRYSRDTLVRMMRARGLTVLLVACGIGIVSGAMVVAMGAMVQMMHNLLFGLQGDTRLSGTHALSSPAQAAIPAVGGAILGLTIIFLRRQRYRTPVDPIEANALHGGRMSVTDTFIVGIQTIISCGFGASVGLEAGYTQAGSGFASRIARSLGWRRSDVRVLVGCGAAGAISAAFGAPLTGAFYGFELIIGVYSMANVAPVMASALCAFLLSSHLGGAQFPLNAGDLPVLSATQYLPFLFFGVLCGFISIAIMQLVTLVERAFLKFSIDAALRPMLGGVLVGLLGLITPQVLASGHGALHRELIMSYSITVVGTLFCLKLLASAISLGSGFRGGLFFASLFLGALLGKMFAGALAFAAPQLGVDPLVSSVVGMSALAVGIVGGPLTMTFLALESSSDLALTGVVLASCILSSLLVRETFGYSFSTWRFHLRGETIRSAHDVGWMRNLTVGNMMRGDIRTVPGSISLEAFCKEVPLGSAQRVVALDDEGRYEGVLIVPDIHALHPEDTAEDEPVSNFAKYKETVLVPTMNVKSAADEFASAGSEELAVVEDRISRKVVGLLTEGHLLRRYAEELDKARRDLSGER